MTDVLTKEQSSRCMQAIRGKDTHPEKVVRSLLHQMGYRFRLHRKDLPGTPDIVLPRHRTIVEVAGCYWHRHPGCRYATVPKKNTKFWTKKFEENVARDKRVRRQLRRRGWRVLTVWECQLKRPARVAERLKRELSR